LDVTSVQLFIGVFAYTWRADTSRDHCEVASK